VRGYEVAQLGDLERLPVLDGQLLWRPIRRRFDIRGFGANAYTAERAGDLVVEEHTETGSGHEELYFVVSGRATFTLDGDEIDAPAGTIVFLPDPAVKRRATAVESGTTVLASGARPGEAFEPSAWETFLAAYAYRDLGDADRGHRLLREAVEREPDRAVLRYHLACFDSLSGDREAALDHLRRAVELDPEIATWAANDSDLDAIRDDPRFPSPIAGKTDAGSAGA
jgi:tetratricopeptide (TPR) repeat protein